MTVKELKKLQKDLREYERQYGRTHLGFEKNALKAIDISILSAIAAEKAAPEVKP